MRVIVCGGRNFNNREFVWRHLDSFVEENSITELAQGGASGVDWLAKSWSLNRGVPMQEFRADWDTYGYAAGPIRNKQMLESFKPDCVIAFCYGSGKGTRNMINLAESQGYRVIKIEGSI